MAITEQITCDVCGKPKGEVNHWWMFRSISHSPALLYSGVSFPAMQTAPWTEDAHREFRHACGQQCLIKAVSEWMASQSEQSK